MTLDFQTIQLLAPIAEIITAIVAAVGAVAAYMKWNDSNRFRRCTVTYEIIRQFYNDEGVRSVLYVIEYGDWAYDEKFHGSKDGQLFDKTFSYLDNIAKLKEECVLDVDDYGSIFYLMHRLLQNKNVLCYLWNIYHFANKSGAKNPFGNLYKYAIKQKLIKENEFLSMEQTDYRKKVLKF